MLKPGAFSSALKATEPHLRVCPAYATNGTARLGYSVVQNASAHATNPVVRAVHYK